MPNVSEPHHLNRYYTGYPPRTERENNSARYAIYFVIEATRTRTSTLDRLLHLGFSLEIGMARKSKHLVSLAQAAL